MYCVSVTSMSFTRWPRGLPDGARTQYSHHVVLSVPGPTVDRRVSVNSGAEKMGATTQCLDMCVLTNKERSSVSCKDATACLGEWSSGVVHAGTTVTSHALATENCPDIPWHQRSHVVQRSTEIQYAAAAAHLNVTTGPAKLTVTAPADVTLQIDNSNAKQLDVTPHPCQAA